MGCAAGEAHVEKLKLASNSPDPFAHVVRTLQNLAGKGKRFASIYIDPSLAPVSTRPAIASRIDPRLVQLPVTEVAAAHAHL